jgi:hypothetical protein
MLFEVFDQIPALYLITKLVQIIDHIITTVNSHTCNRNIHIASFECEARHERPKDPDNGRSIRKGPIRHLLQFVDNVLALRFKFLYHLLDFSRFYLDVLIEIPVELLLKLKEERMLSHWDVLIVVLLLLLLLLAREGIKLKLVPIGGLECFPWWPLTA